MSFSVIPSCFPLFSNNEAQVSWLHSCYTMLLLKENTLVPYFGDLFMKACPSQAVLAHSQKAPAIANVFAVGYSIVKER